MMKKAIKQYIWLLAAGLVFSSCKKFLTQTSQDEIRPATAADLTQLLNGEGYPYTTPVDTYVDLLTDDIQCSGIPIVNGAPATATYSSFLKNATPIFTWDPAMFDSTQVVDIPNLGGVNSWKIYYGKIKGCNVVLDYLDKVSGTDKEKNALKGQALFLRGFYYLKLMTLYAQPYNGAGIDVTTTPGVPLILSSEVTDVRKPRNSIAEVYAQIEKDLLEAATLLKDNFVPVNTFRVGYQAAYALLSRLYLYMGRDEDMDKVIANTGMVLAERPGLTILTSYITGTGSFNLAGIYDQVMSQEVIWQYGNNTSASTTFYTAANAAASTMPVFNVSQELVNLYDKGTGSSNMGDLRYVGWYWKTTGTAWPYRSTKVSLNAQYGDKGIRVAELYLNRAEALATRFKRTGNTADRDQALLDLNALRQSRYDTRNTPYTPVTITDADALVKFCREERRRELALEEGHRWCDIKRWGLSVTHKLIDANGITTTYTLTSGSKMYALPIPYTAMNRNDQLAQNPR